MSKFKPVTLTKDGKTRVANSATVETNLRYAGWRTATGKKQAATTSGPSASSSATS